MGGNIDIQKAADLSPEEKRSLIKERLKQRLEKRALAPKTCALSFAQQRLWFLHQLEQGSANYNIPMAASLEGRLDELALERSINEVVRRHEALRTTFHMIDGQSMQVIAPPSYAPLAKTDLRELEEGEREAQVTRLAQEEAHRPFDLTTGPLFRVVLIRIREDEHVLLFTMPHIVADGWSINVLVRELTAIYAAFSAGAPSPLPDLPLQYTDFVQWQRRQLTDEVLEQQLLYWKDRLAGAPAALELPTDRPRPAIRTTRGAQYLFSVPPSLSDALNALARREGATPFMVLLTAFYVLLGRYAGQRDVSVGTPVAGRTRTEAEGLIGLFVNTLVLRARWEEGEGFRGLLRGVRERVLEAQAHQELPFERLVEELQPERSLSRTPLFQVAFAMLDMETPATRLPDLKLKMLGIKNTTAKFDLTLSMDASPQGFQGTFEYSTDLFDEGTIARMASHYGSILRHVVAEPDVAVSGVEMLSPEERQQLLFGFNEAQAAYPPHACLHELFEEQAAKTPDATALVFEGESLSYDELNKRANRLARHLRTLGAGPEQLVALLMERSVEMIVSLLGVLKAGAAYLPLDPAYPGQRLQLMLDDSGARILLTQEALAGQLPEHGVVAVLLDSQREEIEAQSGENLEPLATPDNLAYVIYTSGSTGTPKGVMVSHASLAHYTRTAADLFSLSPSDRLLQFASVSFDASAEEIYPTLCAGARLVLRPDDMLGSVSTFLRRCGEMGVTVLDLPTAYWHELVGGLSGKEVGLGPGLRLVVIGGEQALARHAEKWARRAGGGVKLLNSYGPTEATIVATMGEVGAGKEVTIGRPINGAAVYILDGRMGPAPVGVTGELYVGGMGVARGYLRRPALTAERFIPDPFSTREGGRRLYRTGDLARWLPSGELEYVGRADDQAKVRGFRVELGEIESALLRLKGVRGACVGASEGRLIAYVVADAGGAGGAGGAGVAGGEGASVVALDGAQVAGWREGLRRALPDHMVPSLFVGLSALPLTPSGKVDRRRLPEPDGDAALHDTYVAPRDTLELELARLWEEVLRVEPVGVKSSFFELGGTSLLAVRLFALIERKFGLRMPLAVLFRAPTVAQLAGSLRRQSATVERASSLVEIRSGDAARPFFCVHPVSGHVLCYAELSRHLGTEQPFYGLQAVGVDGEEFAHRRIEEMATHYVEALRAAQPAGPYMLGGWSMGGHVAYEMARQLHAHGEEVALLALIDSYAPSSRRRAEDEASLLYGFAEDLGLPLERFSISPGRLDALPPDERLTYALEEAKKAGVIHPDMSAEQARRLYELFKINVGAMNSYSPQPYPGRVTLFAAQERPDGSPHDPTLGWSGLAAGVEVHVVPGDHYSVVREPHVRFLAERLTACLQTTAAESS
jgi:amino acid adenylation domain-containing protein